MFTKGHAIAFLAGAALLAGGRQYMDDRAANEARDAHFAAHLKETAENLGHEIDKLNVRYAMEHPTPGGASDEPKLSPAHRHDTASVTRRDSFDRRPSAEGGMP